MTAAQMDQQTPVHESRTEQTVLPPTDTSLAEIEAFLASHPGQTSLVTPDGSTKTAIPDQVYDILKRVVDALAHGSAVTIAPVSMRLTTGQAAEILGVSRPTLIRLLEDGAIPYEQPRRHRLLRLDDVLAFKRNQHSQRKTILAEMTRQSAADGLYDHTAEDYSEALRQARHSQGL